MDNQNSLLGIFQVLWKWKYAIILVCFLTGIISIIASLQLDTYYQAHTTFLPASQDVFKPESIFGGDGVQYLYGGREDVDRLLAISESQEIKNFLIDSFNLFEVYEINPENPKATLMINTSLNQLYNIIKTKYNAIQINIEDTDPLRARNMANAARDRSAYVYEKMMTHRLVSLLNIMQNDNRKRTLYRNSLNDSLILWRRQYGIINYQSQSEVMAELITSTESSLIKKRAQVKALSRGSLVHQDTIEIMKAEILGLDKQLESLTSPTSSSKINLPKLAQGKEKVRSAQQRLDIETNHINYQGLKIDQYATTIQNGFNSLYILEEAVVPYVKSRPRRSKMVMGAVFLAFVMSVLGALLFDRLKDIDWKSKMS